MYMDIGHCFCTIDRQTDRQLFDVVLLLSRALTQGPGRYNIFYS